MPFTRSNADAGHSPSVAQDQRLRRPCRRLGKLDTAFELRYGKEPAASCIMMQPKTVLPTARLGSLCFPSRLLEVRGKKLEVGRWKVESGTK